MRKEIFEIAKKELQHIGLIFLLVLIIFKIVFYKENFIIISRNVLSLFWLFALPGYFIMLYWSESIRFIERFFIGIILSAGIIGTASYYFGLIGLNIKYHAVILPLILILAGAVFSLRKNQSHQKSNNQ